MVVRTTNPLKKALLARAFKIDGCLLLLYCCNLSRKRLEYVIPTEATEVPTKSGEGAERRNLNNMHFNIITIFPDLISHYCAESILGRAQKNGLIKINPFDSRNYTSDKHRTVDDTSYGGGPGMVMKPEPIYYALKDLKALAQSKAGAGGGLGGLIKLKTIIKRKIGHGRKTRTILLSPRGRQFNQHRAEDWSCLDELTFVCGRYEGVDQRVADYMVDEEISIGPYVLAGGELGALVIIESIARLLPGVLGNEESLRRETSFVEESGHQDADGLINGIPAPNQVGGKPPIGSRASFFAGMTKEYPQYTKPANFRGWQVPEVLLSGDHEKIEEWRSSV